MNRLLSLAAVMLIAFAAVFAVSRSATTAGLVPDDAVMLWASAITAGDGQMPVGRMVAAYPTIPFLATTLLEFVTPARTPTPVLLTGAVLALFAGLAGFLPYLGPIIGAVPMVLVAGGESLDLALWVVGLYALIQFLESYLLTPLIQARAVSMPPAVVILSQLVLGAVFGILGLALATPIAAAATVPLRYLFGVGSDQTGNAKVASK